MRKKTTLSEIAAASGVSVITASRAMRGIGSVNPQTRQRILDAAQKLGYSRKEGLIFSNSSVRNKPGHALRILLPVFPHPDGIAGERFVPTSIITSLQKTLEASGGVLTIVEADHPEDLLTRKLPRAKQHGIVLRQTLPVDWTRKLQQIAPVVYAISHDVVPGTDCIEFNEFKSAAMIYNYLLERGHRDIVWISRDRTPPHLNVDFSQYNPFSGFDRQAYNFVWIRSAAWAGLDLGIRNDSVRNHHLCIRAVYPQNEAADGKMIAQQILEMEPRPTAVVTYFAGDIPHISSELKKAGLRTPEDISFITYLPDTDPGLPEINPTRISMPYEQAGQLILELIQRRISLPEAPYITISLETQLKEGNTVADLRAHPDPPAMESTVRLISTQQIGRKQEPIGSA